MATKMRPGDWMCPNCNDHQFGRNVKCRKCGTAKEEQGELNTKGGDALPVKRERQAGEEIDATVKRAKVDETNDWDKSKLCVFGVGKFATKFSVASFVDEKKLAYKKIVKLKNQGYALISFADEAAASKAREVLDGAIFKKHELWVEWGKIKRQREITPAEAERERKRLSESNALVDWLKQRIGDQYPRSVKDTTCPLWEMPYQEQLDRKRWDMWRVMLKLWRKTRMEYFKRAKQLAGGKKSNTKLTKAHFFRHDELAKSNIPKWLHDTGIRQKEEPGGEAVVTEDVDQTGTQTEEPPLKKARQTLEEKATPETACPPLFCPFDPVLASPLTHGYRNKCEFTVGKDGVGEDGGTPCVGFRLGSFKNGSTRIGSVADCPHVSPAMKEIVQRAENFIRSSPLAVYTLGEHVGVWRVLLVRCSERTKGLMVMMQADPKSVEGEVWEKEKARFVDFMTSAAVANASAAAEDSSSPSATGAPAMPVTSVFIQEYSGVSSPAPDHPVQCIWGDEHIEEEVLGLRFRISPGAFFQVNTAAAECLYSLVRELACGPSKLLASSADGDSNKSDSKNLVLDICCGTGTIACCMAASAPQVVGVELCQAATEDAVRNAQANRIKNVHFIHSKAEAVMGGLLSALGGDNSQKTKSPERATKVASTKVLSKDLDGKVVGAKVITVASGSVSVVPPPAEPDEENTSVKVASLEDVKKLISGDEVTLVGAESASGKGSRYDGVVAIVDPPRTGLHKDVIQALRNCPLLRRVVYVSCNPRVSLIENGVGLCGPTSKLFKGDAFQPVYARPVDLFPHTAHCEMVMVFER